MKQRVRKRWEIVEESLCRKIPGPEELEVTKIQIKPSFIIKNISLISK